MEILKNGSLDAILIPKRSCLWLSQPNFNRIRLYL